MISRNPWLDQVKGIACLLIISHHLAFYGPMVDVFEPFFGRTVSWFREYARMAVQVFLVVGGYLSAAALAPQGYARPGPLLPRLSKRYARLVLPYGVALILTIAVTELIRQWGFNHASMSSPPSLLQFIAHLVLLHGVFGWESLSAGVWYVAIDFQLFVLTVIWFGITRNLAVMTRFPLSAVINYMPQSGVACLTALSLLVWNRDSTLDAWALYFYGAYGLGLMAWWAAHPPNTRVRLYWCCFIVVLVAVALTVQWRDRIAVAGIAATLLALSTAIAWPQVVQRGLLTPLQRLGQISYSVFLIHFGMSLLVNAVIHTLWPRSVWANGLGIVGAIALSIWAGTLLYRYVENKRWAGVFGQRAFFKDNAI